MRPASPICKKNTTATSPQARQNTISLLARERSQAGSSRDENTIVSGMYQAPRRRQRMSSPRRGTNKQKTTATATALRTICVMLQHGLTATMCGSAVCSSCGECFLSLPTGDRTPSASLSTVYSREGGLQSRFFFTLTKNMRLSFYSAAVQTNPTTPCVKNTGAPGMP